MRRRGWGAAVVAVAAVTGTLVFQWIGDADGSGDEGKSGPIRTSTTTAALTVSGDGTSARLDRRDTAPFSLLGVSWTDPAAHVTGTVEARARSTANGTWSKWQRLDGNSGDGAQDASRGGTAPTWFGPSDGVEVRMSGGSSRRLPEGLRVAMVDPGSSTTSRLEPAGFVMDPVDPTDTADPVTPDPPSEPASADPSAPESAEPPPAETTSAAPTETTVPAQSPSVSPSVSAPASATPSASAVSAPPAPASSAPRPPITSRAGWGADESISPEEPGYLPGGKIKAVVLHHTATSNDASCADTPALIRSIYAYDVQELTWKDIGYNFLVDKCGTIYEGRKGGVDRPVMGAHAYGFNSETTGIAIIGDYSTLAPSREAMTSVARLAAWKLGQYGVDPTGTTTLTAGAAGPNYFRQTWAAGTKMTFPVIHGHRDGYNTVCPGDAYYNLLPTIRAWAGGPVEGLTLDSVTGDGMSGTTVLTGSAVTLKWSATTPAVLVRQYDVLVDGKVAVTVAGSATSARVDLAPGTHKVAVQGVHQSGWAAVSTDVTVLAEPAPATTAATTPAATPTTPVPTTTPTTPAPSTTPTTKPGATADKTPPAFSTKPNLALGLGTVNTTAVPLALKWKAADAGGLKEVRLTAPVAKTYGPTVLSANLTAKPGVATTWKMTAYDRAGNTASASVSGTPVLLQETSATRTGTWTAKSSTSYLGGKSYGSSTKNASLTWTFTGRSAALVVSRATTSGQVYVYVDGVKTATVDLKSSTTKYRDAIWTKTWSASAKHTVKIVVVGTAGRPAVTTDGLVYLK
ncbi:N-acetylmuramoyl-L-alanine amidase [Streptomyces sp. NPDC002265]|uniref:peptidoglycan recognition protein family protein n=1 Tax=Streptomyces sp. NPDC002265 TaxID=3154415 RepID=UPI00332F1E18